MYTCTYVCISYNTGKSTLPDTYRHMACSAQGQVRIHEANHECLVITNMLHFQHSKMCPNLKPTAHLVYIVTDADFNCGKLF